MTSLLNSITLIDSNDKSQVDGWFGLPGDTAEFGQSFLMTQTIYLNSITFFGTRSGGVTGNATANLYAHTGTFGTSGTPTGAALATSDPFDITKIGNGGLDFTTFEIFTLNFSGVNRFRLVSGTSYFITIAYGGSNYLLVGLDHTPTHAGNLAYFSGGIWNVGTADTLFYLYGSHDTTSPAIQIRPAAFRPGSGR